jgi:hypothetical protein
MFDIIGAIIGILDGDRKEERNMGPAEESACKQFVENWFCDANVFDMFEGTAHVQRLLVSQRVFGETGPRRDEQYER